MPARKISAKYALELSTSTMTPSMNRSMLMPMSGSPKNAMYIWRNNGVPRTTLM